MTVNSSIAATQTGSNTFNGCLAEVWFANTYIDFSNVSNILSFVSNTLLPVNLGPVGNTTTGIIPIVYLKGNVITFNVNNGLDGNYTIVGGLIACNTPLPSL